jgi:hypothetical protein
MMSKIKLFNVIKKTTNDQIDLLYKQYQLYLSSAETISERRQTANNYMWTINAALISGFGLSLASVNDLLTFRLLISGLGIVLCIFWNQLIASYKKINSVKFQVIHEIEKKLPMNLYAYEWEKINADEKNRYKTFTSIEVNIPTVFFVFWIITLIVLIWPMLQGSLCSA